MARVEITNEESAEAWLETQSERTRLWFATRCGLRLFPIVATVPNIDFDTVALRSLRSLLTASTAVATQDADIDRLVDPIAHTTTSATGAFLGSIARTPPASKYGHVAETAHALYAAQKDTERPCEWFSLWPDRQMTKKMALLWAKVRSTMEESPQNWAFWLEWYEAILEGKPLDWDLTRRIAREVTEAEWDAGPEVVARRIEGIKASFLSEKVPLAETVELNPETQKFRAVPIPVENPAFLGALIARTSDAIEDALAGGNGLRKDGREVRTLKRTHERYANDPQRVEMDYTSVAVSLRRQIRQTGELAETEDNLALLEAVEEGALAIRAHHPTVAQNRNTIALQKLREMDEQSIELLEDALPMLMDLSEGVMRDDFQRDIPNLINDATQPLPSGAPPLPGADEVTRIFNRVGKMKNLYDRICEKGADVFDSKGNKTARLGLGIAGALWALVELGLKLLGAS